MSKPVYTFEEVVKHYSDTYIDKCKEECPLCNHMWEILEKYDFLGLTKNWDYDD